MRPRCSQYPVPVKRASQPSERGCIRRKLPQARSRCRTLSKFVVVKESRENLPAACVPFLLRHGLPPGTFRSHRTLNLPLVAESGQVQSIRVSHINIKATAPDAVAQFAALLCQRSHSVINLETLQSAAPHINRNGDQLFVHGDFHWPDNCFSIGGLQHHLNSVPQIVALSRHDGRSSKHEACPNPLGRLFYLPPEFCPAFVQAVRLVAAIVWILFGHSN